MAAVRLHPALRRVFRILDQDAALREFHEADEGDDDDGAAENEQDDATAHRAFANLGEELREAARQLRENTGHDNQRHTVADAAAGDLFAEPHQEERPADEADDRADRSEEHTSELKSLMRTSYAV